MKFEFFMPTIPWKLSMRVYKYNIKYDSGNWRYSKHENEKAQLNVQTINLLCIFILLIIDAGSKTRLKTLSCKKYKFATSSKP